MNVLEEIIAYGNRPFWRDDWDVKTYEAHRAERPNWIRLGDGTVISVIAGVGTMCEPRPCYSEELKMPWEVSRDYPGPYTGVEVWFPEGGSPTGGTGPEYCQVEDLLTYVEERGGVKSAHLSESEAQGLDTTDNTQ